MTRAIGWFVRLGLRAACGAAIGSLVSVATAAFADSADVLWVASGGHEAPVHAVAYSPDGVFLATAGQDRGIRVLRLADGQVARVLRGHSGAVTSLAFAPDGQTLASGSEDQTIRLWHVSDGTILRTMTQAEWGGAVRSVAFSPNGLLVASAGDDRTIKIWWAADGTPLQTLEGHTASVKGVAFSGDGQTLASGSADATIRMWKTADWSAAGTLTESAAVNAVAVSPDGLSVAAGGWRWIHIRRISDGTLLQSMSPRNVQSLNFSPNGQTLGSASSRIDAGNAGQVQLWRVTDGGLTRTLLDQNDSYAAAFSPDGEFLAAAGSDRVYRVWRASDGALVQTIKGHMGATLSVAFSPDGGTVVSGSVDRSVKIWRAADGQLLRTLTENAGQVFSVDYSPDGELLVSGGDDRTIRAWRASDGTLLQSIPVPGGSVYGVAFSPDGRILAAAVSDKTIRFYRVADWAPLRTLTGHMAGVRRIAFSPNGQLLASAAGDQTARVWRVSDGQLLRTVPASNRLRAESVAFSPDMQILAVGPGDAPWNCDYCNVPLYRVSDGSLLREFEYHTGQVNGVAFTPDGQILVSASTDGTIKLWDVWGGALLKTYDPGVGVSSLALSADGQHLAYGLADGSVANALAPALGGDTRPSAPVLIAPDDGVVVSPRPTFVMRATDPDGDDLQFRVEVYDQAGNVRRFSSARVASGEETSVTLPAAEVLPTHLYRWRATANDGRFDGLPSDWRTFWVPDNQAPSVPAAIGPANDAAVSTQPVFELAATDVDGDRLRYKIQIRQGASVVSTFDQTQDAAGWSEADYGSGETAMLIVSTPLASGSYQWRAYSYDGTDWSGASPSRSLSVVANRPPVKPMLLSPVSGTVVRQTPAFSVSVGDPDGDPLLLLVELSQGPTVVRTVEWTIGAAGGTARVEVPQEDPLPAGAYTWRARAHDGSAYGEWSDAQSFAVVWGSRPPSAPIVAAGTDEAGRTSPAPVFKLSAHDPDGDRLVFRLEILQGSNIVRTFDRTQSSAGWDAESYASDEVGTYTMSVADALPEGAYRCRAFAYDGSAWSEPGEEATFVVGTRVRWNALAPGGLVAQLPMFQVGFSAENALEDEEFVLRLEASRLPDFSGPLVVFDQGKSGAWSKATSQANDLVFVLPEDFRFPLGSTWYWRARVKRVAGGEWSDSSPARAIYVYPGYVVQSDTSVVRFGREDVTHITLHNPYEHDTDYVLKMKVQLDDPGGEFQSHVRFRSAAGEVIDEFDLGSNESGILRWASPRLAPGGHDFVLEQTVTGAPAGGGTGGGSRITDGSGALAPVVAVIVTVGAGIAISYLTEWAAREATLRALGASDKLKPAEGESQADYDNAFRGAMNGFGDALSRYEITDEMTSWGDQLQDLQRQSDVAATDLEIYRGEAERATRELDELAARRTDLKRGADWAGELMGRFGEDSQQYKAYKSVFDRLNGQISKIDLKTSELGSVRDTALRKAGQLDSELNLVLKPQIGVLEQRLQGRIESEAMDAFLDRWAAELGQKGLDKSAQEVGESIAKRGLKGLKKAIPYVGAVFVLWDISDGYNSALDLVNSCNPDNDPNVRNQREIRRSWDPNMKVGALGKEGFTQLTDDPLPYRILFENKAEATAAAQEVTVTDILDDDLDLTTFSFTGAGFGGHTDSFDSGAVFWQDVDLRPDQDVVVQIQGWLEEETRTVTVTFRGLDPDTWELHPDGFLPPNHSPPEGEGFVSFSIAPIADLPSGTEIDNEATIVFDVNPPMQTNETYLVVDTDPPASAVGTLASVQPNTTFAVPFTATDAVSGVRRVELWYADPLGSPGDEKAAVITVGDYGYKLAGTTDAGGTQIEFAGQAGYEYRFFTVAVDVVGNREAEPQEPDAVVHVGVLPTPTPVACPGDCDADGAVTADEVVLGMHIALGRVELANCRALDRNDSGTVTIEELVNGVKHALRGCSS